MCADSASWCKAWVRLTEACHVLTVLEQATPYWPTFSVQGDQDGLAAKRLCGSSMPSAFLPSPQSLVGLDRVEITQNPATTVTCSWTTPLLHESAALVQEGALRWACAALTQDLPGPTTARVRPELKRLHPASLGSAMFTPRLSPEASVHSVRSASIECPQSTSIECPQHWHWHTRVAFVLLISRRPPALRRLITFFAFASPCGCTCGRLNGGAPWTQQVGPGSPRSVLQ